MAKGSKHRKVSDSMKKQIIEMFTGDHPKAVRDRNGILDNRVTTISRILKVRRGMVSTQIDHYLNSKSPPI